MPLCCINQHRNPSGKVWCTECDSLVETASIGDYVIASCIGQGAITAVYLAHQPRLNSRKVVIKVLHSVASQESINDFRKEAAVLASLSHPYILPIYDYDIIEEVRVDQLGNYTYSPYLVLRYMEQGSLDQIFKQEGNRPWSLQRVLPIIKEAASALGYAHSRGIIHRDVKPANIFLFGSHIMLAGFSVAASIEPDDTYLDAPWAGSPAYMAPEVWRYKLGRYSDQYALAVTCYRLLTGEYPWKIATGGVTQWIHLHQYVAPSPLSDYRPDLPIEVGLVLRRALAKDPHERFANVKEFANALEQASLSNVSIGIAKETAFVRQQLGNYRLVRHLSRGGFAEIYLGEHISLKTQVAVKVLHASVGEDDLERFRKEAYILSNLHHPNMVQFIEFSESPIPFLVMTLAPNGTLRERHPSGKRLPLTAIVPYVKQIASALQYMHEQGYVHQNVKPESIFLGEDDKVLLGSLALAISTQNTSDHPIAGTPAYMAPEQIQDNPLPASDQYALGIVVYEWLYGENPFKGTLNEIIRQHLSTSPLPMREQDPTIPLVIEQVVMKALAKDAQERFASVQEFADALEQAYQVLQQFNEVLQQTRTSLQGLIDVLQQIGVSLQDATGVFISSSLQGFADVLRQASLSLQSSASSLKEGSSQGLSYGVLQASELLRDASAALLKINVSSQQADKQSLQQTRQALASSIESLQNILQYLEESAYHVENDKDTLHDITRILQRTNTYLRTYTEALQRAVQLEEPLHTQPSVPPLDKDDILITLSISAAEALNGITRQVKPQERGRSVTITVPANAYEGQIIRLEGKGKRRNWLSRAGALLVQIHVEQQEVVSSPAQIMAGFPVQIEQEKSVDFPDQEQPDRLWPTRKDYDRAMWQLQRTSLDPDLRSGRVTRDSLGGIAHYGEANLYAAMYKVTTAPSAQNPSGDWMILCFGYTANWGLPLDIIDRYQHISRFCLANLDRVSALLPVIYVERGIRVDCVDIDNETVTATRVVPIVKMPFISARSLASFVTIYHQDAQMMERLCIAWLRMIRELESVQMAHGALDLTNVLVVEEDADLTLKLIDYNHVWIPALSGRPQTELVHEDLQHPAFQNPNPYFYDAGMDRFAALVIYISLRAICLRPHLYEEWEYELWETAGSPRLLFSMKDDRESRAQAQVSAGYVSRIAQLRQMGIEVLTPYLDELSYALQNRCMPRSLVDIPLPSASPAVELLEKIDSPSSLTSNVRSTEPLLASPTITYEIFLVTFPSSPLTIGRTLEVSLYLSHSSDNDNTTGYRFELPRNEAVGGELNLLLTAPGFQFNGESVASLPIEVPLEGEIASSPQVARFMLVALRPGTAKVSAEVYKGSDFLTNLEEEVQVLGLVGLEGIDEDYRLSSSSNPIRSRPVPQPDLILQVQTEWNVDASVCKFWYVLNSFHRSSSIRGGSYRSPSLSAGWVERSQRLLGSMLEECAGGQPEDMRARLASFGYSLFQSVFPLVLQSEVRNLVRSERMLTLLILADQDAWLPWEVLHTGQAFLGEQFVIGRWMRELDEARPYEFPVGGVHVAHYANVPQPEVWVDLLTFPDIPEPLLLPVFADLEAAEAMRGLHLIRYGHSSGPLDLHDAPMMLDMAKSNGSVEAELRPAKLSLRRNRPLVSLGYVSAGQPELTGLEQAWAPTFVRAGCSAFVGPMWAVQPTVQAAFVSGFYSRLWAGDSLAGALHMGRRLAKAAAPDSLDWLAYVLFGDPMARPYRPVQGQGYALVEPIGREMDDPVPAGGSARFRVSLRRTPPVWHEERVIEVAETLNFGNLQVYVVTFGLEVIPSPPIAMKKLTPDGDYLGWFNLSVPPDITAKEVRVQVHFVDGMHPVHSLAFPLKLATRGGDIR